MQFNLAKVSKMAVEIGDFGQFEAILAPILNTGSGSAKAPLQTCAASGTIFSTTRCLIVVLKKSSGTEQAPANQACFSRNIPCSSYRGAKQAKLGR
jgi:hypothetical protein